MGLIPLRGKIPIVESWTTRTFSKREIQAHLAKGGNVGWALEPTDLVLDIDPRHGGKRALAELLRRTGLTSVDLKPYPRTLTGGGGMHIWLSCATSLNGAPVVVKGLEGIEFKRRGSQVVVPPSIHPDTKQPYVYAPGAPRQYPPPPAPSQIIELLQAAGHKPAEAVSAPRLELAVVAEMLGKLDPCDFAANERWFPLLAATHDATGGSAEGLALFMDWSLGDPLYADHGPLIEARWKSLKTAGKPNAITLRTLIAEVSRTHKMDPALSAQLDFAADPLDETPAPASPPTPPKSDGRDRLSDIGYRIAKRVRADSYQDLLIHAADQQYWHYIGTHWEPVADNMIDAALLDATLQYLTRAKKCKLSAASIMSQGRTVLKALCATPTDLLGVSGLRPIINCQNGEVHIGSNGFEFKNHRPESYLTSVLATTYEPGATCPQFDRVLGEIFENEPESAEVVRHFWELVGYSIQPHKNIAAWILFYGYGSNGKTFILNTLTELWGEAVIEKSVASLDINRNNHALADLPRRLVMVDDDYKYKQLLPDSALKKISENKMLSANPKNRPVFRFRNTAIAIIASNGWPQTTDLSDGLRRRALVFNFSREFTKDQADINLLERVKPELPGILNRALAGYARLRARGQFDVPAACEAAKHTWYKHSNQAMQFIEEVKSDKAGTCAFNDLWAAYEIWAGEQRSRNRFSRNGLKKAFESLGYEIKNGRVLNFALNTENYSGINSDEF